jgi:lauroyl/myristoyl acyltransferase
VNLNLVVLRLAAAVLPRLPIAVVERLADVAGWLAWLGATRARRAVCSNLRVVLGVAPSGAQVRAVFRTAAHNYCDLFALPRLATADVRSRVVVDGWDHLASALGGGRGVILASMHLGNLEIVGYAAHCHGLTVMLPVERLEPPELLDLMLGLRRRAGFMCEPVGRDAFARIRAALGQNAAVGIGADRITLGAGEVVVFCGRPARMPVAAGLVALRTGAPVLAIGSERLPGGRYRLRISAPIPLVRGATARETLRTATERILRELEVFLRANPTQWVVFRPIWETPDGTGVERQ